MNSTVEKYDVAVIGGGPAGMIAAGKAAELGARVILIEKNHSLGKKLLVTGGGRCNFTNAESDVRKLVRHYGDSGKYLISAFYHFGVTETLDFFRKLGIKAKIEKDGRIFPSTDSASSFLQALLKYLEDNSVAVAKGAIIKDFKIDKAGLARLDVGSKDIMAKKVIIATGGIACPSTGSNGDFFQFLKRMGHNIVPTKPALVPLKVKEKFCRRLSGLGFNNVELHFSKIKQRGDFLFTHFGISGPAVLNLSEHLQPGDEITVDLFPEKDIDTLSKELQSIIDESPNKNVENVFNKILPERFVEVLLYNLHLDAKKKANGFSREDRKVFAIGLKNIKLHVTGNLGYEQAMYSRGGIDLSEINLRKMQSKIMPQIYFVGDILDVSRECGGFSLQLCWTTGFIAGESVVESGA